MKKLFFIANWKSHKTPDEVRSWFESFPRYIGSLPEEKEIIVCPPFPLLPLCVELAKKHTPFVKVGAQDISYFEEGAYTGEVSGRLLKAFATHVIIGHSERRKYFSETEEELSEKVIQAHANLIMPVYCVSNDHQPVPKGVSIVAYEPIEAIGSGNAADPTVVGQIADSIKAKNSVSYILYGGSVAPTNVANYTNIPSIQGVLVGGASLDPEEFAQIIHHA